MRRLRTASTAALVLLAIVPAAAAAERPPSAAAIERATERFLATRPAAEPAARAGGTVTPPLTGELFPASRVVSFYGAPQMGQTILGMRSPPSAAKRLAAQSAPYESLGTRPVVGAFDLVSVFATAGGGTDCLYRLRQSPDVIGLYLEQARASGLRLMLDIQPGRSTFTAETAALAGWLAQPEVDLALDPEWNVGRNGIPGQTPGKVGARQVNEVIRALSAIVRENALPPKLLVVHQFRRGMIRGKTRIRPRRGVQVLFNFDGIGSPSAKAVGYGALASPVLFNGFSLFYQRDTPLMKPGAVLALEPEPDFLLYQ
jgi:hypothetical protein